MPFRTGGADPVFFGLGSDGAKIFDSDITLSGDIYATTVVVIPGVTVNTAGFCIFANESINVEETASVINNGSDVGLNLLGGGAGGLAGTLAGGYFGGNGATLTGNGIGGTGSNISIGGNGGTGGGGLGHTGGGGGSVDATSLFGRQNNLFSWLQGHAIINGTITTLNGGAGGGGGGGTVGGGGGGGGGIVLLASPSISIAGTVSANGGAGGSTSGSPASGNGGGGAGGGAVILVYGTLFNPGGTGLILATGGAGGSVTGGLGVLHGGAGGNGGHIYQFTNSLFSNVPLVGTNGANGTP